MNPTHPTAKFLRRHRRRARGTLLAWTFAVTLAAAAFVVGASLRWTTWPTEWVLLPIAFAVLLLAAWIRRVHELTPRRLAQELDTRWQLRSRLESAVELARENSAWANQQRDDATQQIAGRQPPGALPWFAGLVAVTALLGLLSFEGAVVAMRALQKPPPATVTTTPVTEKSVTTSEPPGEFHPSIEWKSPKSEITATAIEEIPLSAIADSKTGFRSATLEVTVNGNRQSNHPLDTATLAPATSAGPQEIATSLYLDELEVKEGDLVSYRLVAELNSPAGEKVASPPGFIEIRRAQRDAALRGDAVSPIAALLLELKSRQLDLLKQNSALAQGSRTEGGAAWETKNSRLADAQEALAGRAAELPDLMRSAKVPAAISEKAKDIETLMHEAAAKISAQENENATPPQTRALAIITELSQNIRRALSGATTPVSDPFDDRQAFKLVPRAETPAGALEELARRQQKNNTQLAEASGAASGGGDTAHEQAAISRDAATLSSGGGLDLPAQNAAAAGADAARDAAQQLGHDDPIAARVPAATAQREFEAAVAAQNKAGEAAAAATLEQLRRSLNAASRASATVRTQKIVEARNALRTAATEQQRSGSADAARDLAQLSELTSPTRNTGTATAPNSPERAREIAVAAAGLQVQLMSHGTAVNRAVRLLRRADQTGDLAAVLSDVELASQEAQWLSNDAPTIELAQQVAGDANTRQSGNGDGAFSRATIEKTEKLATALEQGRRQRDELTRHFNPADIDPAYRGAVENYFERLSRDARPTATPAPAK